MVIHNRDSMCVTQWSALECFKTIAVSYFELVIDVIDYLTVVTIKEFKWDICHGYLDEFVNSSSDGCHYWSRNCSLFVLFDLYLYGYVFSDPYLSVCPFCFCPLCCMSFFYLRILIIPFVSSSSSCIFSNN
jgi:hypothetical protein